MTRRDADAKRSRREERANEASTVAASDGTNAPREGAEKPPRKGNAPSRGEPKPPVKQVAAKTGTTSPTDVAAKAILSAVRGEDEEGPRSIDDEHETHHLEGEEWARPLAALDARWTWLESRMLFVTLLGLVAVLCMWIGLRGMQDKGTVSGIFFRALFGMGVLGGVTQKLTEGRGLTEKQRTLATLFAVAVGAALAKSWAHVGNEYFQGVLDWLQQGSSIALFGGLRGISTRLTMLVALIGGSLACAAGTHINVDVIVRFAPKEARKLAHVVAMLGASLVCLAASYGFFDFTAVSGFHAAPDATLGQKFGAMVHELDDDFFILRKQLSLDLGALPYVAQGKRWNADERMTGRQWNAFVDEGGFAERYGAEKAASIKAGPSELDAPRRPFVIIPDGTAAGALLEALNLVFPMGFLMLGLRLILRVFLVMGGFLEPHLEGEGSGDDDGGAASDAAGEVA